MSALINMITQGWPPQKSQLDPALTPFWSYRDELTIHAGVVYKGLQVIIPDKLRKTMLKKIHVAHFGAESNIHYIFAHPNVCCPLWGRVKHSDVQRCNVLARYES